MSVTYGLTFKGQDRTQIDSVWEQGAEEDIWNQTDLTEGWTELHSQEPYDLYSLQILFNSVQFILHSFDP
jgi:hypothetical protein